MHHNIHKNIEQNNCFQHWGNGCRTFSNPITGMNYISKYIFKNKSVILNCINISQYFCHFQ